MPIYNPGNLFTLNDGYGPRPSPGNGGSTNHKGQDFSAPINTPIPSAANGTVFYSGNLHGFGNTIVIKHNINGNIVYTLYAHMNKLSPLKVGDYVSQGDEIGNVGDTGSSTGPHLHFEVIKSQKYPLKKGHDTYDPASFDFPDNINGESQDDSTAPDPSTSRSYNDARDFPLYCDPLILDLDGDGLELTSTSGKTLFDHDGDGIKTRTGWVSSDDGLLARDLNGNGIIDSGKELFGADTPPSLYIHIAIKPPPQQRNGFQALKELDSNQDNQFTKLDEAWNSVKVWRDLNQDGISQPTEIFTLEELNITAISLQSSSGNSNGASNLINGNNVSDHAEFTQNGENKTIGAVNFSINPFYRQYNDPLPPTDATKNLPDMRGSGLVRNLRDAATRDSALQTTLSNFSNATNRRKHCTHPHR